MRGHDCLDEAISNMRRDIHMKSIMNRTTIMTGATTAMLGMALISLTSCGQGESTTNQLTPGGSAGLSGPMVFVNNTGDKSLTSMALRGDSGNAVVGTIPAARFEDVALGDMQFSEGEWLFVNLGAANKVATVDPLTGATPAHTVNLVTGTRPVHIYRDTTDGEVIWSMNDGDNAVGTPTPGDDLINCAVQTGGSVTILHNSHQGPGTHPPTVEKTVCVLADGHKVMAFSSGANIPKRAFVSSETAGEIAVINNEPGAGQWNMTHRIDLCNPDKEDDPATCNPEDPTSGTAFTPNNARPHGIRWSKLTQRIYSIQEGYGQIVEIDPTPTQPIITRTFDLTAPYTSFGITPDGRFLLLRGQTITPQSTKLGVLDISVDPPVLTDLTNADLDAALADTSPGSFKFSPDGKRFYILAGNAAATTKKDRLFAFDASTLTTSTPPALTLLKEIPLTVGGNSVGFNAAHNMDVLAQGAPGAGEAKYIVVSNRLDNSVSIINATTNTKTQDVQVGPAPGAVLVYYVNAAAADNQATASLTGGS
jgi:YVTN family beta-propeller protein